MSKNRKFKGRRRTQRRVNRIPLRQRFLIVCEGEKTEPNYFRAFRAPSDVRVKVEGVGYNTVSLVEEAIELMQKDDYDQVWCVFDRDDFPAVNFNEAIQLARRNGINIAYSNEAFELWYLLHFHYHDAATIRRLYKGMLTKRLGFPYKKNDPCMYDILVDRQSDAIRNATTLLESYETAHNPEKDNPSTTVHHLVQELNRFSK